MSATSKPVFLAGAFDNIGASDVRFLEEASKFGELTVLLWSDALFRNRFGGASKFPENERAYLLQAVRFVNGVKLVHDGAHENALLNSSDAKSSTWVLRESDGAPAKTSLEHRGLNCRVIRDEELRGFPDVTATQPKNSGRKKVLVTGCYDWLHSGHVRFFEEVSSYGDLFVVVGHDANIRLLKGEGRPLFPHEQRRYLVGAIRYVTQALISTGDGWLDAEPEIKRLQPDIYAVNEDGDRPEKRDYCARHGIKYLVLKRTPAPGLPARSSTDLRGKS